MTARPVFADRGPALSFGATVAALAALVASDLLAPRSARDEVRDEGTANLVAAAIAVAVATSGASLGRPDRRPLPRRRRLFRLGLLCTWAGIAVNRWGRWALGSRYRPVITVLADHQVVRTGPYRFVRHPMYAGSVLMCLGAGAVLGTGPAAAAWLLPPLALLRRIAVEDRVLAEALGERHAAYAAGRARLVPGIW